MKFLNRAILLASVTLMAASSFATGGGQNGNGDGDTAFALQRLARANPGLNSTEILLKAFKESAGRIPTINYRLSDEDGIVSKFYGFPLERSQGVEFILEPGANQTPNEVSNALKFQRAVTSVGPLLQPTAKETFSIRAHESGEVTIANGSLMLMTTLLSSGITSQWMELRSYDKSTVIFVTHPLAGTGGHNRCLGLAWTMDSETKKTKDEYCSVGYFWQSK